MTALLTCAWAAPPSRPSRTRSRGYRFELDKGVTLKDGKDVTVIATGLMVQMALKAREMMAAEGVSVRVIDMHTIKPLDGELVRKAALETGCIVTSEEHSIIGGLGGAVAEFLSENCPTPLVRHGVNDALRPQRHGQRRARGLRPDAGGPVRQDPRSAGKETLRFLASALLQRGGGFLLWRTDL